jgi:hypothetical protein
MIYDSKKAERRGTGSSKGLQISLSSALDATAKGKIGRLVP